MATVLSKVDAVVVDAASAICAAWGATPGNDLFAFARGMLSPLTYRALRTGGGLPAPDVVRHVADTLVHAAEAERSARATETANH
jgi:hypothetical protein